MQFEYFNPIAGLVMLVAGLVLLILGYHLYGIPPIIVGVFLVGYYRKYLLQIMGV